MKLKIAMKYQTQTLAHERHERMYTHSFFLTSGV